MVICNDNMMRRHFARRHFASTRYHGNSSLLSVMCVLCVIAQRLSIQPLGSLCWPSAEQKHRPLVVHICSVNVFLRGYSLCGVTGRSVLLEEGSKQKVIP